MQIEREGWFRGYPVSAGLEESKDSQALAFAIHLTASQEWNGEAYVDCEPRDVYSRTYIIKRDGTVSVNGVEQLKEAIGWDGDFSKLKDGDWTEICVSVQVKAETYNGKTQFKGTWISKWDATPMGGKMGNIAPEKFGPLAAKYGSQMRALCGASPTPKPAGAPKAPPKTVKDQVPAVDEHGVPF